MFKTFFRKLFLVLVLLLTEHSMSAQTNSQSLNARERNMSGIAALTAVGNMEKLKLELNAALGAGVTINEIKETLVHLYAYCGFPRSLNGIINFMSVLEERKAKGIKDIMGKDSSPIKDTVAKYERGKRTLQALTGREEKDPKTGFNGFSPVIDTFLKEHLFADIFSRDLLSHRQRELITISVLSAMSGVESQLQSHLSIGLNLGMTEGQLKEIFDLTEMHIGKDRAESARATLMKITSPQANEVTHNGNVTPQKVRLAKVVVDAAQLENYKALLKEEIEASIQKEPGVLTLYAVFEKERPTHLTILEIYASEEAYQLHLKTPHFLKYKNGTANMVKGLELVETDPLIPTLKIK